MDTKQKLNEALKEAMKAGDDVRRRTLRMSLASIKNLEIDRGSPVDDSGIISIIQKEIKSRREAVEEARKANRPDLESASLAEIKVLEEFLPQQLSMDELQVLIDEAITDTNASQPSDMGKIMKVLLPKIQGRAANDKVSALVKASLQK